MLNVSTGQRSAVMNKRNAWKDFRMSGKYVKEYAPTLNKSHVTYCCIFFSDSKRDILTEHIELSNLKKLHCISGPRQGSATIEWHWICPWLKGRLVSLLGVQSLVQYSILLDPLQLSLASRMNGSWLLTFSKGRKVTSARECPGKLKCLPTPVSLLLLMTPLVSLV